MAGALLGMAAASCGGGRAGGSPADSEFLSAVHVAAPDIGTYRDDTQLVRMGHAACDGFGAGASYVQLADRLALLEGSHALPSQDLGAVITAAADVYCPRFRSKVS